MFGAVDIGGTKTLLATFDKEGKLIKKIRFPTPPDYEDFKKLVEKSVVDLSTKDLLIVTCAVPARIDRKKGIALAFGRLSWENIPIQADMEAIFKSPVLIENDSKLAGLSEAINVIDEYKKVLYVTISTGINSALVVNGIIDPQSLDSETGQLLLEHNGKLMRWQEFASGKAIVEQFGKPARDITDQRDWYVIAHNIALGLIDLIATLTPQVIIIGGGVGAHFEKFEVKLNEDLLLYQNDLLTIPPIRKAARAEDAVIYGCYFYARRAYDRANH